MIQFADRMTQMAERADATRKLYNSMTTKGVLSFGGGAPAPDTYPVDELREIANDLLQYPGRGRDALAYSDPQGLVEMRKVVAEKMLPRRGIQGASVDDILIVNGGLETMNLAGQVFLNKGDVVLVENPSFCQTMQIFDMFETKMIPITCDEHGVIVEDMIEKIEKYDPKLVYIITSFHNPAARTTILDRRKRIAEYANTHDVMILEDDPYVELRYEGEDIPAIKAFDTAGHVIYANSFSKIFSPGSRIGYCYAANEVIRKIYDAKTATNSQTSTLIQMLCAEYFNRGYYDKHIEQCRAFYKVKCDKAVDCLHKYFPEGTKVIKPEGGLFIWVELPENTPDTTTLYDEAVSRLNIAFLAGRTFFVDPKDGDHGMRMSFGSLSLEDIEKGIRQLGDLIKSEMK